MIKLEGENRENLIIDQLGEERCKGIKVGVTSVTVSERRDRGNIKENICWK